jgi:hypothetical protein
MTKQSPIKHTYKDDQEATRQALAPRSLHTFGTINLGIRAFKKINPGNHYLISIFKQNAWASIHAPKFKKS